MADSGSDYQVGPGRPPLHTRFQKAVRQPRRPQRQEPVGALGRRAERANLCDDRRRRKITRREAIVTQMVDKSASADLRATKMLIDMLKEVEEKAGTASPEPAKLTPPDREVVELFVARLRRQIAAEAEAAAAAAEFVVPAKAGTQEPATEVPLFEPAASSGFPLSRE